VVVDESREEVETLLMVEGDAGNSKEKEEE